MAASLPSVHLVPPGGPEWVSQVGTDTKHVCICLFPLLSTLLFPSVSLSFYLSMPVDSVFTELPWWLGGKRREPGFDP